MRKIIANGTTLRSDGMYYIVTEQLEDNSVVSLLDEPLDESKQYPDQHDIDARVAYVNALLDEPLTEEEIGFMMSYRPSGVI